MKYILFLLCLTLIGYIFKRGGIFHNHTYVLLDTVKTLPNKEFLTKSKIKCSEDMAEKLMLGLTTHIFKCSTCFDIKKIESLGE